MSKKQRFGGHRSASREHQQGVLAFAGQNSLVDESAPIDCVIGRSQLYSVLVTLIERLENATAAGVDVINWGSPVLSFGAVWTARVATVGINPSNREFVDDDGAELTGMARRFHTLSSLGIDSWIEVDVRHLRAILMSCAEYFNNNPYNTWFGRLNEVIGAIGVSFYGPAANACHLDLVPFATANKWTELKPRVRASLLSISSDALPLVLRESKVETIVLNGTSVVEHFQRMTGVDLDRIRIPGSDLGRQGGRDVLGYGFRGAATSLLGVPLDRKVTILGYNHNVQSSFGVTKASVRAIQDWLARSVRNA
jgi:hypothetical protein